MEETNTWLTGCWFCDNAAVNEDLDPDYDLGYIGVKANVDQGYNMMMVSGNRKKTHIEVTKDGHIVAIYTPKFCPECGRPLMENKEKK